MKTKLILTAALITMFVIGAHGYSKPRENSEGNKKSSKVSQYNIKENTAAQESNVKCIAVENIWKSMPSYDKYGNEITERARNNMRENMDLLKANRDKLKGSCINREEK